MSERDFWGMTLGELARWFDARRRETQAKAEMRAALDYKQAYAIGRAFAATQSRRNKFPSFDDIYGALLEADQEYQERKAEREAEAFAAKFAAFMDASDRRIKAKGVQDG